MLVDTKRVIGQAIESARHYAIELKRKLYVIQEGSKFYIVDFAWMYENKVLEEQSLYIAAP